MLKSTDSMTDSGSTGEGDAETGVLEAAAPQATEPKATAQQGEPGDGESPDASASSDESPRPVSHTEEAEAAERRALARLYEGEQRVEGRQRWSVSGAHRRCGGCEGTLGSEFHTVLAAAADVDARSLHPECAEVFERQDYCDDCFERVEPGKTFAHWKSVLPPPDKPPRKIVNLASLLAYFERLTGTDTPPPKSEDENEIAADDTSDEVVASGGEGGEEAAPGSNDNSTDASTSQETGTPQLAYMLALFLVRKRVLKWVDLVEGTLRLSRKIEVDGKPSEKLYAVSAPLGGRASENALRAFEELFE